MNHGSMYCSWNHWLLLKQFYASVEVPPAPFRVSIQWPVAPSVISFTSVS